MGDREFYITELAGNGCRCGLAKDKGKAFCWRCFKKLGRDVQRRLRLPVGRGYEEAYEEACRELESE